MQSSSSPTTSPPTPRDDGISVDSDIPSAQVRPERQADTVDQAPAPNPPPADNEDSSDLDKSGDLLLQYGDLAKLNDFRAKWIETFTSEHSWDEFSDLCVPFASDTREMAQYLNRPKNPKPNPQGDPPPPPLPPPRRPTHDRGLGSDL